MSFQRSLDTFVREVLQNSQDAARGDGSPVTVTFEHRVLRGPERAAMLKALEWSELRRHLEAAAEGQPVLRNTLRRTASEELSVLLIHDRGTLGLGGDEQSTTGRFANFARNKLISEKSDSGAGGSFGLGKSVLWLFSGWQTIFVNSVPLGSDGKPEAKRFIGISQLPSHDLDRAGFDGPGWYGERGDGWRKGKDWSKSARDPDHRLLAGLGLERPSAWTTGTSFLLPDFWSAEGESTDEIMGAIEAAAARWFWPLLASGRLQVETIRDGERQVVDVGARANMKPWLHLSGITPRTEWAGDTRDRVLPLRVPAIQEVHKNRTDLVAHGRTDIPEALKLSVLDREDSGSEDVGTIAWLRGSGMVIKLQEFKADRPFVALLRAGRALRDDDRALLVEQFLRAAEPPSHDDWTKTAPKLADLYSRGYKTPLDHLPKRVIEALRECLSEREGRVDPEQTPQVLSKAFRLGSGKKPGTGKRQGRFDYAITRCELVGSGDALAWSFDGWAHSTYEGPWAFEVDCAMVGDSDSEPLPTVQLAVRPEAKAVKDRVFLVPSAGRVELKGLAPLNEMGALAASASFQIDLRRRRVPKGGQS